MNAYSSRHELASLGHDRVSQLGDVAAARHRRRTIVSRIVDYFHERAALREMNALSDRELADIGLHRSDLSHVFDPAFVAARTY